MQRENELGKEQLLKLQGKHMTTLKQLQASPERIKELEAHRPAAQARIPPTIKRAPQFETPLPRNWESSPGSNRLGGERTSTSSCERESGRSTGCGEGPPRNDRERLPRFYPETRVSSNNSESAGTLHMVIDEGLLRPALPITLCTGRLTKCCNSPSFVRSPRNPP